MGSEPFVTKRLKVVFIRVPKTGSTSVVRSLYQKGIPGWNNEGHPTHILARHVDPELVEKYRDYTWIGGIRHPYTWIPSFYTWISSKLEHNREPYLHDPRVDMPWYDFIQNIKYTPMDWLTHDDVVVQVYKQEDPKTIEELLGVKLPTLNVSKSKPKLELDEDLIQLIHTKFQKELSYYDPYTR